jgi:pimeloyl-ACP methyl ester carboxylesterase
MQNFPDGWVVVPVVAGRHETVYGVKTHYVHAGDGEPLILIHGGGAGGSGEHGWFNALPVLGERFHVYAPDLIGYGYTDKPEVEYSFQFLVNHLAGFIDALNLKQVRLVGNSQGAYIVLKYACDFPERVKQLVTISTSTLSSAMGLGKAASADRALGPPEYEFNRESMRNFLKSIINDHSKITEELIDARFELSQLPGAEHAKRSIMQYRKLVESPTPDPHQWQVFCVRERAPKLQMPWQVIWGGADRTAPLDLVEDMRRLCPNITRLDVIQESGHQVQNDKPEETNRVLLEFLGADVRSAVTA